MRIQSPLSNLRDVLTQVRESAKTHQKTLATNEDATRAALVDPVLRALGWEVANPRMVEVEKLSNNKSARADYALMHSDPSLQVQVIVEAKKLGEALGQHALSLINYAFSFQVSSVFLTDGMIWQHFKQFQPQGFKASTTLDLQNGDLGDIAAYLVQELDAAKFWSDRPDVDTLADEINQLRSDLQTLQQQVIRLTTGPPPPPPPPPPPAASWKDLDSILNVSVANTTPTSLRLPDGTVVPIKFWRDVLTVMCNFVLLRVPGISIPLLDNSGLAVNLLDTTAPSKGSAFVTVPYGAQTVYVYTNYAAKNCILNALHILQKLPASQQTIKPAVIYS